MRANKDLLRFTQQRHDQQAFTVFVSPSWIRQWKVAARKTCPKISALPPSLSQQSPCLNRLLKPVR